jgi:predicted metal-dependent hydrolase
MKKEIDIPGLGTATFVQSPRARRLRITIKADKTIIVTIPRNGTPQQAEQFLHSRTVWIQKQLQKIAQYVQLQDTADLNIDLEKAQNDLFNRLEFLAKSHNFAYNRASFRCQKTRWGSCSKKNYINLNINIVFLPEHLQNYIILHELVHTIVKNHSKKFWAELNNHTAGRAKLLNNQLKKYRIRLF